ncbi:MAG TPA: hypothetical protein VI423_08085 [Paenisporosarcina sp.]|nr:hypothetical protein [Paenisporosarcina sp.]
MECWAIVEIKTDGEEIILGLIRTKDAQERALARVAQLKAENEKRIVEARLYNGPIRKSWI